MYVKLCLGLQYSISGKYGSFVLWQLALNLNETVVLMFLIYKSKIQRENIVTIQFSNIQ